MRNSLTCIVATGLSISAAFLPAASAQESSPSTLPASASNDQVRRMLGTKFERRSTIEAIALAQSKTRDIAAALGANVAVGRWGEVKRMLDSLPPQDALRVHLQIVNSLASTLPSSRSGGPLRADQVVSPQDVVELANALPAGVPIPEANLVAIGQLLGRTTGSDGVPDALVKSVMSGTATLGGVPEIDRRSAAVILWAAGDARHAVQFLPDYSQASPEQKAEYSRIYAAFFIASARDARIAPQADDIQADVQNAVACLTTGLTQATREPQSDVRISELFSFITEFDGFDQLEPWLADQFKSNPVLTRAVLTFAGSPIAGSGENSESHLRSLELRGRIAGTWLSATASQPAADRAPTAEMLLGPWLAECVATTTPPAPNPAQGSPGMPMPGPTRMAPDRPTVQPIAASELLRLKPTEEWMALLPPTSATRVWRANFLLLLDSGDHSKAVDLIPRILAGQAGDSSQVLAGAVLDSWTRDHLSVVAKTGAPAARPVSLPVPDGIQSENLKELAGLARQLTATCGAPPPSVPLMNAFSTAYEKTQVYSDADIELVFGPPATLQTDIAEMLALRTRDSLSTASRALSAQGNNPQKIIEIIDAFSRAESFLTKRLEVTPFSYRLSFCLALVQFDDSEFRRVHNVQTGSWIALRDRSFESFQQTWKAVSKTPAGRDFAVEVLARWYTCAMGSTEPKTLSADSVDQPEQLAAIGQCLDEVAQPAAGGLRAQFGNALVEQSAKVPAECEQLFARSALRLVAGTPAGERFQRSTAYYDALTSEMELRVVLDGAAQVGTDAPFGVKMSIVHTDQLNREIGGFSQILAGALPVLPTSPGARQTSMNLRGKINYREKLEAYMRHAFSDGLELVSVTWADGQTTLPVAEKTGWSEMPLGYAIVRSRDKATHLLPSLRMDLDFADRNDNELVVLPVQSQALVIDSAAAPTRPFEPILITQTLNPREAASGKVSLVLHATCHGVTPGIDSLVDLSDLGDFQVEQVSSDPLLLNQYELDRDAMRARTERTWTILLKRADGQSGTAPARFRFPAPVAGSKNGTDMRLLTTTETEVVPAGREVMVGMPGRGVLGYRWVMAGVAMAVVGAIVLILRGRRRVRAVAAERALPPAPAHRTPFSVLNFLRMLELSPEAKGFSIEQREELALDIATVERTFFADTIDRRPQPAEASLHEVLDKWDRTIAGLN